VELPGSRRVHLVSIVHAFSCRLHGLRRYEKALKDELEGAGR